MLRRDAGGIGYNRPPFVAWPRFPMFELRLVYLSSHLANV
jgi:hypothetical protein